MKMPDTLRRFGVSMEPALLAQLDDFVSQKGYQNRSHAIRLLIKEAMLKNLQEKTIVHASILMTQGELMSRFEQIVTRCTYFGQLHTITTLFNTNQMIALQLMLEMPTESIPLFKEDPLLQPIHIQGDGKL